MGLLSVFPTKVLEVENLRYIVGLSNICYTDAR